MNDLQALSIVTLAWLATVLPTLVVQLAVLSYKRHAGSLTGDYGDHFGFAFASSMFWPLVLVGLLGYSAWWLMDRSMLSLARHRGRIAPERTPELAEAERELDVFLEVKP